MHSQPPRLATARCSRRRRNCSQSSDPSPGGAMLNGQLENENHRSDGYLCPCGGSKLSRVKRSRHQSLVQPGPGHLVSPPTTPVSVESENISCMSSGNLLKLGRPSTRSTSS